MSARPRNGARLSQCYFYALLSLWAHRLQCVPPNRRCWTGTRAAQSLHSPCRTSRSEPQARLEHVRDQSGIKSDSSTRLRQAFPRKSAACSPAAGAFISPLCQKSSSAEPSEKLAWSWSGTEENERVWRRSPLFPKLNIPTPSLLPRRLHECVCAPSSPRTLSLTDSRTHTHTQWDPPPKTHTSHHNSSRFITGCYRTATRKHTFDIFHILHIPWHLPTYYERLHRLA